MSTRSSQKSWCLIKSPDYRARQSLIIPKSVSMGNPRASYQFLAIRWTIGEQRYFGCPLALSRASERWALISSTSLSSKLASSVFASPCARRLFSIGSAEYLRTRTVPSSSATLTCEGAPMIPAISACPCPSGAALPEPQRERYLTQVSGAGSQLGFAPSPGIAQRRCLPQPPAARRGPTPRLAS